MNSPEHETASESPPAPSAAEHARFARLAAVFEAVIETEPAAREAVLVEACAGDDELRRQVEALLAHDSQVRADTEAELVVRPISVGAIRAALNSAEAGDGGEAGAALIPGRIGAFKIVRELGRGGMSVVYLAEQERPRRTVALKVLPGWAATPEALRRFELEAEVLGLLQHPAVAQVYEAGTAPTELGPRPYFAMEHIQGRPLLEYVRQEKLGHKQILELFARICDGVAHAHQKGVIHRDLKPANVLVDACGQPKILDFGVARVTRSDVQAATLNTTVGQLVGTIPYMSPEQAAGHVTLIDTRSDVYTLGVILFEMLTGRLPYDLEKKPDRERLRVVQDEMPTRLGALRRELRGDLQTILLKVLEKNPRSRYQGAEYLRDDVRRFCRGEPVLARPRSTAYAIRKFATRNRVLMVGVVVGLLVVATAAVGVAIQWRRSARLAERLVAVQSYTRRILGGEDHILAETPSSLLTVLRNAEDHVGEALATLPLAEADQRVTIGLAYAALGANEKAADQLQQAYAIRERELGANDDASLSALEKLGRVKAEFVWAIDTDRPGFLISMDKLLAARMRLWGMNDPRALQARAAHARAIGIARSGRAAEALATFVEVIPRLASEVGEENPITIRTRRDFAELLHRQHRFVEESAILRLVLDAEERMFGESSPEYIDSLVRLGVSIHDREHGGALEVLQRAVELSDAHLGTDYFLRWEAHHQLGRVLTAAGRYAEADLHLRTAFEATYSLFRPRYGNILQALVENDDLIGNWVDAESKQRMFWNEHVVGWSGYPHYQADHLAMLARFVGAQGRSLEAAGILDQGEAILTAHSGMERDFGFARALIYSTRASLLVDAGRCADADVLLREALKQLVSDRIGNSFHLVRRCGHRVLASLIRCAVADGRSADAERWRLCDEAWAARDLLGRLYMQLSWPAEAEACLRPRFDDFREAFGDTDPRTVDVARSLAALCEVRGDTQRARIYTAFVKDAGTPSLDEFIAE